MRVGIIGAGIVGRLLAWHLCQQNVEIHLFDQDDIEKGKGCSCIAAGMISPIAERTVLPAPWYQIGLESLQWWPKILASLSLPVFYQATGTLVVCHLDQKALLEHFVKFLQQEEPTLSLPILEINRLHAIEPALNPFVGCYLPNEAWINPRDFLKSLSDYLLKKGVQWHPQHVVNTLSKTTIQTNKGQYKVDKIFDCRGLGAKTALPELRAVRGEILLCHSDSIHLTHAIRLLHARFPCYIVPQGSGVYAIGATQIESSDQNGVYLQSAVELLSAAIKVNSEFREASIISVTAHLRPTARSHTPLIVEKDGITYINGMFRHGYLLAPALTAQIALNFGEIYESKI